MSSDDVRVPLEQVLDRLEQVVRDGRAMPLSASCVVNRDEVLALVAEARRALPEVLSRATEVLGDKEGVVAAGRSEAERLLTQAREQQAALVSRTSVHEKASTEAAKVLQEAEAQAEAMRLEVEEYVDAKLANFEVVLSKTLEAVRRGRDRLHGESELDDLGEGPLSAADQPPLPGAPRR